MELSKQKQRIIFRADGNGHIGLGHVVRSLALAEMLRHDFGCVFAIQAPSAELQQQIRETCEGLIILPACEPDEERFEYELDAYIAEDVIVVLDGYHFATRYQQHIKRKGCPLFYIDDLQAFEIPADVVLNQAGGVDGSKYKTAEYTKLLLGPKYALLRPPFLKTASKKRVFPGGAIRLFLNLGGADPKNHTLEIAQELAKVEFISKVEIVVGSAYKHLTELKAWVTTNPTYGLHQNLGARELGRLMEGCAMAITSASGVAYEYASVGGLLYAMQTADNQSGLYDFLTNNGLAFTYEELSQLKSNDIEQAFDEKVNIQRQHFEGGPGERLREVFKILGLMAGMKLREVTPEDMMLLFNWANDPEVRKRSFNPNPILLEGHSRWLQARLADERTKLYIAEVAGEPAAHIRFELKSSTATISYLIGPGFRGRGLGHVVLQKGTDRLVRQNPDLRLIEGLVQRDNIASVRAFEKAGFQYGQPDPSHPDAHRFVLQPKTMKQE
ncbi:UDP-2,4-diacetamido-2,4,6-trideoxy-beta-L-altropyranose hydrolase [Pontibacter oryzae]|uniref:UDP-2,4-diacetamido-2,4, 6-trideoxy-beta-L-altropyranose hydrolase n=1 Tax=Pontibacter oryzae TaxID=2304593 RepID=A0A399SIM1_9BACT|nr:UDP-2,4-diacetamido-2,4,6-trideoxy-beta-L-altropyranose hydrolase [Pontibacter oryzae]RIJ41972.1 UDP-2,4-diacetamido-2,4,6-trideoxy-beta-L-altropyranose hydrolase [Pontibacter oryzae]